jgi:hypothetical protein
MAGPATHINYVTDHGVTYRVLVPSWQQAFTGDAVATSTTTPPRGFQRRHRMLRGDTTGKEYRVTVGDTALTVWTANPGAAVASPPTIPGAADTAFHYGGRVNGKELIRG